jgi:MFS transporter, FHS family, L-fucose permease
VWAVIILRTKFPVIRSEHEGKGEDHGRLADLLRFPISGERSLLSFCMSAPQVGTGSYFIQYVQEYAHEPEKIAGYFLTGTLAAFGIGRFGSACLMRFVSPSTWMGVYALANIFLVGVGVLHPGWIGVWCVFLTSFFMSVMFPTMFVLGLKDLGPNTKLGGSLLVMAIIGGAVLMPAMGLVREAFHGVAPAYSLPLVSYAYVAI